MSTSISVHSAVEASRSAPDFTVNEDAGRLVVTGTFSPGALVAWQRVFDDAPVWLSVRCVDGSQDEVNPGTVQVGERVRVTLAFVPTPGSTHLFTVEGWRSFLLDDARVRNSTSVRLAFAAAEDVFSTRAFPVDRWVGEPVASEPPESSEPRTEVGPRRVVRSQSPDLMAPSRIEPFITSGEPAPGPAFAAWREVAAAMIARALPNELYRDGTEGWLILSGQPPRKLVLGSGTVTDVGFRALLSAASWVYLEGTDVEVRHTFLTAELAREWTFGESFRDGLPTRLPPALDSARLLYKAHLRSSSKDTLKALADLRKTLAEEVQKLLQQSRDLSTAVWRDIAVAVGVMVVRLAVDSTKSAAAGKGFAWVFLMVALYVAASFRMSVGTNRRFLDIVEQSRAAWRTKLYGFLDDADYGTLADRPVTEALAAYRRTENRSTVFVVVVCFALMAGAAVEGGWIDLDAIWTVVRDVVGDAWSYLVNALAKGVSYLGAAWGP
ncbi:hypothetical protein [Methylobacterium sp. 391_Methyba4]|uniref:hypothetical protein n=1 Tax=Methylobacterium sp. 391_Methyba4 TaxID=3038924 RepID=UPI00241C98C8|nr:hypothetical protein [Methylobacterium sp. 391_Methyba4]WFS06484.1 hypothetical protein P9K36_24335 [Methylobacterium sp. 391_Methyba4]